MWGRFSAESWGCERTRRFPGEAPGSYPHAAGGLDHIATVVFELAEKIDPERLGILAPVFERTVIQRLAHLLSDSENPERAEVLSRGLPPRHSLPWVELDPGAAGDPDLSPAPTERDERWRGIVRKAPEADA